jgi:hypothetical protein
VEATVVSLGVVVLAALVGLAMAFAGLAARRGGAVAFVRLCWVPLVALVLAMIARERLGLTLVLALLAIVLASVGLVAFGIALTVGAKRQGSSSAAALMWATIVAGIPLLTPAIMWVVRGMHPR